MKIIKHLFILLLFISLVYGELLAQKMPKDFQFNYKFGLYIEDQTIFDSKSDTLICHGIDTIMKFKINLTEEEKESIFEEMQKINLTSYPERYYYQHPDSVEAFIGSPFHRYFLTITTNGNSKLVEWDNSIESTAKDEKHEALMQLDRFIEKILWSRNPLKDYHPKRMRL
jgi:hypothetical protein